MMYIVHPNYIYKQVEASDLKDGLVFMLRSLCCHLFIIWLIWNQTYMESNVWCSQNMTNFPEVYWATDFLCNSKDPGCIFFEVAKISYLNFNPAIWEH